MVLSVLYYWQAEHTYTCPVYTGSNADFFSSYRHFLFDPSSGYFLWNVAGKYGLTQQSSASCTGFKHWRNRAYVSGVGLHKDVRSLIEGCQRIGTFYQGRSRHLPPPPPHPPAFLALSELAVATLAVAVRQWQFASKNTLYKPALL